MTFRPRARLLAVAVALTAALTAGCARHDGGAAQPQKSARTSAQPSGRQPSGYAEMQKKADDAESAAAVADNDTADDGTADAGGR